MTPIFERPRHVEYLFKMRDAARGDRRVQSLGDTEEDRVLFDYLRERGLIALEKYYAPTGESPCEEFHRWVITSAGARVLKSYTPTTQLKSRYGRYWRRHAG